MERLDPMGRPRMTYFSNQGLWQVSKYILQMKVEAPLGNPIDSYSIFAKIGSTHWQRQLSLTTIFQVFLAGRPGRREGAALRVLFEGRSFSFFFEEVAHKRERKHHDSWFILSFKKKDLRYLALYSCRTLWVWSCWMWNTSCTSHAPKRTIHAGHCFMPGLAEERAQLNYSWQGEGCLFAPWT